MPSKESRRGRLLAKLFEGLINPLGCDPALWPVGWQTGMCRFKDSDCLTTPESDNPVQRLFPHCRLGVVQGPCQEPQRLWTAALPQATNDVGADGAILRLVEGCDHQTDRVRACLDQPEERNFGQAISQASQVVSDFLLAGDHGNTYGTSAA